MAFIEKRRQLLATAGAMLCLAPAPAAAQAAGPEETRPATAPAQDGERLVGMSLAGRAEGKLRPFAGGILPNAGKIRTFAGDVAGTAGKIRTFQGDASASAGEILGAAGKIRTFAGKIRTFSSEVTPQTSAGASFWGTLTPRAGTLSASAGKIRTFEGDFEGMAGKIRTFAGKIRTFSGDLLGYDLASVEYHDLNGGFRALVEGTKASWGDTIQQQTGRTFEAAFADRMLTKYGIDLNDARSLDGLNEVGVELFLLDWYDNLTLYSGQDQVDHWMKPINWSPALTQSLGEGYDAKIGILDFSLTGEEAGNVVKSSGVSSVAGGHGSAVASLITARHDGRGVMGIAPGVQVVSYNPFDETYTAGWTDIKNGVKYLLENKASIINMSLGVPGSTLHSGWNDVFKEDSISKEARKRVFVLAAGNEGVTQSGEVAWNFDKNPNVIVVGSVDPDGAISAFSNRPGETRFKKLAGADPLGTDMLKSRFIVAPGEFMLVSDGAGGVTRMSGTSFAAPLVSGTIALVHDRWPWLADNPVDTVNLILNSARDVGAPGVDGVYGRGMLDVQKALEPNSFWTLKWKQSVNGVIKDVTATSVLQTSQTTRSSWEANKVYFTVFEDTGAAKDSYRDFNIPMSSKLIGQTVGTTGEQFQGYLQSRFWSWFDGAQDSSGAGPAPAPGPRGFTAPRFTAPMASIGGLETVAVASPRTWRPGLRQSGVPFDTGLALRSPDQRFGVRFGTGDGSGLVGQRGFGMRSDHDVLTGGANPFMGLASGAAYAAVEMRIGERVTVSTGVSRQNAVMDLDRMNYRERQILGGVDPYRASANTMVATYRASDKLTTNMGYTLLNEDTGLLGVRSLDPNDLTDGSSTDAATFGADYAVARGLSLSLTGTVGRTRSGDAGSQGITVAPGGLVSSAWQVAMAKDGLFDGNDRMRVTLAQPLHIERGRIGVTGVEVVDRMTGELGDVTQLVDVERGRRRFVAEALYGRSIGDGAAQLNLFGRADLKADERTQAALTLGGSFRLGF